MISKTEKLISLRTAFELPTTDEQIALIAALPAEQFDALLDLYVVAADLDFEEDGGGVSKVWRRIEEMECVAGLF